MARKRPRVNPKPERGFPRIIHRLRRFSQISIKGTFCSREFAAWTIYYLLTLSLSGTKQTRYGTRPPTPTRSLELRWKSIANSATAFWNSSIKLHLALSFKLAASPTRPRWALPVKYKGELLMCSYRADFVCFDNIVIETKAIAKLTGADDAQIINELKATGFQRGILLNFGSSSLEYRRLVFGAPANLRKSVQSVDDFSL